MLAIVVPRRIGSKQSTMNFLRRFLSGYKIPFARYDQDQGAPSGGGCLNVLLGNPRILIALLMIGGGVFKYYFGDTTYQNEFTGRVQHLGIPTPEGEIRMGLASAPHMIQQFGGEVTDPSAQGKVRQVGQRIVNSTKVSKTPYRFQFHLLRDDRTVNAFALPGGQIFITMALFKLLENEDQLAGVLGHEVGHVVGRHSNQQMAKSELLQAVANGVGMATSNGRDGSSMRVAQYVGNLVNLKYGRDDETEADKLGVQFLVECGYNPEAMIGVMEILKRVAGSGRQPQILSTHPDPGDRIEHIREEIARYKATGKW